MKSYRVCKGPWSGLKYFKLTTAFSRPWNPWKTVHFQLWCLKVLEFPLSANHTIYYRVPQRSQRNDFIMSVNFHRVTGLLRSKCYIKVTINKNIIVLAKLIRCLKIPESAWFLCLIFWTSPVLVVTRYAGDQQMDTELTCLNYITDPMLEYYHIYLKSHSIFIVKILVGINTEIRVKNCIYVKVLGLRDN